jgi:hypothetical protein
MLFRICFPQIKLQFLQAYSKYNILKIQIELFHSHFKYPFNISAVQQHQEDKFMNCKLAQKKCSVYF